MFCLSIIFLFAKLDLNKISFKEVQFYKVHLTSPLYLLCNSVMRSKGKRKKKHDCPVFFAAMPQFTRSLNELSPLPVLKKTSGGSTTTMAQACT